MKFLYIQFKKALFKWYKVKKRDLPWRRTKDPYKILISEVMLQQTQVKTVIPFYKRWVKKFGNVRKLAEASLDEVLMQWEGMGYYSRARNLHCAARDIIKNHNGKVPRSYNALLLLPGIGKYTAGAVASIAFNERVPAIDANVRRVLSRLFCLTPASSKDKIFRELALNLMGENAPSSEFNQAMMEVGALICSVRNPRCQICPLSSFCQAYSKGAQARYPASRKAKKIEKINVVLGIVINQGKIYIQKRSAQGLFAGLWEFPGGKMESGEMAGEALYRELQEELGVKIKIVRREQTIRHSYTRFRIVLHPFICLARARFFPKSKTKKFRWITSERLRNYPFPSANRKIILNLTKDKRFQKLLESS